MAILLLEIHLSMCFSVFFSSPIYLRFNPSLNIFGRPFFSHSAIFKSAIPFRTKKIPENKLRKFRNVWNGLFVQQNLQLKCIHLNVVIENKRNTNPTWKCLLSNVVKVSSSSLLSSLARLHHLTSHILVILKCRFVFVFIDNSHSTPHLISFPSMCDTKCY